MTARSMTGFARVDGAFRSTRWNWEIRSVNGRGLDVRLRLPPGYEALDVRIRETVTKRITRGSLQVALSVRREIGVCEIRLNESALEQVLTAAERVRQRIGGEPPRVEGLLQTKGVLEFVEPDEGGPEGEARVEALMASLEQALDGVTAARSAEGARLDAMVRAQLSEAERLVAKVAASPARSPEAIRARLKEQITRLIETYSHLDEARLHQEAALLATRADVEEELGRLRAHIAAARELLAHDEAVGRRLDFLAQEFSREANTLCSKSNDPDMTRSGLALKAVIEQMREQVQNIE